MRTLNRNNFIKNLFAIYVLGITMGSGVYLYMSLIRLDLLLILPTAIVLTIFSYKTKFIYEEMTLFFAISFYLLIAIVHLQVSRNATSMLDIYYLISIYNMMLFSFLLLASNKNYRENLKFVYNLFYYILVFIFASVIFEMFTGYRFTIDIEDPTKAQHIASFFNNPNNLAASSLMIFLIIFYLSKDFGTKMKNRLILSIETFILFITMSRVTLLIFFIVVSLSLFNNIYFILFTLLFIIFIIPNFESILLNLYQSDMGLVSENAERLWLGMYGLNDDKSISYRSEIYEYFINHLDSLRSMGYGTRNFSDFFHSTDLASLNPHSLIIENFLAFGIPGGILFLIILMVVTLKYFSKSNKIVDPLIISIFAFLILSFVPSSSIRLSLMWVPLFIFYTIIGNNNKGTT